MSLLDDVDVAEQVNAAEVQRNDEIRRHQLLRDIDFGSQVQKFLDGPIGQRILLDCEIEQKALVNALLGFNLDVSEQRDEARVVMARLGVLRFWQNKFGEYIIAGRNAEKEVSDQFD